MSVRESRAGDDFHILWAASRVIQLLNPRSNLSIVKLEGLSPSDADDGDDRFLGVDLTEYFGGSNFSGADATVISQLKYSVKKPNRSWTVARLCRPVGSTGASVVKRLAQLFSGLLDEHERTEVVEKLSIRLVSNQPASPGLVEILRLARSEAEKHAVGTNWARIADLLDNRCKTSLSTLRTKSGLRSADFADFIRVLDVSGCGTETRAVQRLDLARTLARIAPTGHHRTIDMLTERVRGEVYPEAAESRGLGKADALAILGIGDERDLYPAPLVASLPSDVVPTPAPLQIASHLTGTAESFTVLHGVAGVGKSTAVLQIEENLPKGSVVVVLDCYGGGDYMNASVNRHSVRSAVVQIANALSFRFGLFPTIMASSAQDHDLWAALERAIDDAAETLATDALLVVAIDAADSSVLAAERRGSRSFVADLWTLNLPPNARVLLTARSHRVELLGLPATAIQLPLSEFDLNASAQHLRNHYPSATAEESEAFHSRSAGNARVQVYAISDSQHRSVEQVVEASDRSLEVIFDELIDEALDARGLLSSDVENLAVLASIVRPASIATLAGVLGAPIEVARDVCVSLSPGVQVVDEHFQFLDEDFEAHLLSRLLPESLISAHNRLSNFFMPLVATDEPASAQIAEHLFLSQRYDELIHLATLEPLPLAIPDGIARAHAGRHRVRLALTAASEAHRPLDIARLLFSAAQAASTNDGVIGIVRSAPELAAAFAETDAVGRIYVDEESEPWLGPAHMTLAALKSRTEELASRSQAQVHKEAAFAWLKIRASRPERDRFLWDLDAEQVANLAEAIYLLDGAEHSAGFVRSWSPLSFQREVTSYLASTVSQRTSARSVRMDLGAVRASALVQAEFLVALSDAGKTPSTRWVREIAQRIARMPEDLSIFHDPPSWGIAFCELVRIHGHGRRRVGNLLARLGAAYPTTSPRDWDSLDRYVAALRATCLNAAVRGVEVSVEEIVDSAIDPFETSQATKDSDRRRYFEALRPLIAVYSARATALHGPVDIQANFDLVETDAEKQRQRLRWRDSWSVRNTYAAWRSAAVDLSLHLDDRAVDAVDTIDELCSQLDPVFAARLRIEDSVRLAHRSEGSGISLKMLGLVTDFLDGASMPYSERLEMLLDASRAALRADDASLAQELFDAAVDAAQGVNDDATTQLKIASNLGVGMAGSVAQEDARRLAVALCRSAEKVSPYVTDPEKWMPYSGVLVAAAGLDAGVGLEFATHWDDDGRIEVGSAVAAVIAGISQTDEISPRDCFWLARMIPLTQYSLMIYLTQIDSLLDATDTSDASVALNLLSGWILREVPIADRQAAAQTMADWCDGRGLGEHQGTLALKRFLEFAGRVRPISHAEENSESASRVSRALPPHEEPRDLSSFLSYVSRLVEGISADDEVVSAARAYGSHVPRSDRLPQLKTLLSTAVTVEGTALSARVRSLCVRTLFEEWRGRTSSIRTWHQAENSAFVNEHFMELFEIGSAVGGSWILSFNPPIRSVDATLAAVGGAVEYLHALNAAHLYAVFEFVAEFLPTDVKADLMEWVLLRIGESDPLVTVLPQPATHEMPLATFLFTMLGHTDKRVRWRTAHAVRGMLEQPASAELVQQLVAGLEDAETSSFSSAEYRFYWMSAGVWLLMVIGKVASVRPDLIRPVIDVLVRIALDREFPHVAWRELARRASLCILDSYPDAIDIETRDRLVITNRPMAALIRRSHTYPADTQSQSRFPFDSMDTLPYWYDPLAYLFDIDRADVVAIADAWIIDKWLLPAGEIPSNPRLEARGGAYLALASNGHGSLPTVESFQLYLEYHALLVATGELLDRSQPILIPDYMPPEDPWTNWLSSHLDFGPSAWTADRRSPTPQIAALFRDPVEALESEVIERGLIDNLVGLGGNADPNVTLCIDGLASLSGRDGWISVSISSALVSPETAIALVSALASSAPHEHFLPQFDTREFAVVDAIREPGFELEALIGTSEHRDTSLDDDDPLAGSISNADIAAQEDMITTLDLVFEPANGGFVAQNGAIVIENESWTDASDDELRSEVSSHGRRSLIGLADLSRYLAARGQSLIIQAHGRWYRNRDPNRGASAEVPDQADVRRFFLITNEGVLDDFDGGL